MPVISSIVNRTLVPLILMTLCPIVVLLLWQLNTVYGGSLAHLYEAIRAQGFVSHLVALFSPYLIPKWDIGAMILGFMLLQAMLLLYLPGKPFEGPITPHGNKPQYVDNGLYAYLITMGLWFLGAHVFQLWDPKILYERFPEIIMAMNGFSLVFCLFLYIKGRFYPSTSDHGMSGNFIFDYYWGTELYPRIGALDIKVLTNCRLGMMSWPLFILSYASAQAASAEGLQDSMIVAVCLQLVYITKFFMWESGYMKSIDIMLDRAGFYICWGCLVWVPAFYTSPTFYLANHPVNLGFPLAALILVLGLLAIALNYWADYQRQIVRSKNGDTTIFGKKPTIITATYQDDKGQTHQSLLLASGFWGISRHFHYLPELLAAFFWSVPALFVHASPFFYVLFLSVLLVHRAFRDDRKCLKKYGDHWHAYCALVPYKILPGVI